MRWMRVSASRALAIRNWSPPSGSVWNWQSARSRQRNGQPCRPPHTGKCRHLRPRSRSEEHTSELQSLMRISYAVFCLKKKKKHKEEQITQEYNDTKCTQTTHTNKYYQFR